MSGGSGQKQANEPWGVTKDYLRGYDPANIYGGYNMLYTSAMNQPSRYTDNGPKYYPGQTYADLTPEQQQAQNLQLGYANSPQMWGTVNSGINALNYGLNSVYDPQSNPVINDYVSSATRPLYETYNEQVMPSIRSAAVDAGGLGGSRQGVAEGIAARGLMNAVGDVSTGVYNNAYNSGMNAQGRALALAPQTMNLGLMPAQLYGSVGDVYQQQNQRAIDEQMARYEYNQNAPFERAMQYVNTLQGVPWSTTSTSGGTNKTAGAIGGATTGAYLGSQVYPGWGTAIGAVLGGLGGYYG